MAGKEKIDLSLLNIVPLTNKKLLKGAFPHEDKEFQHLINWLRTACIQEQRERKSRTYLAVYREQIIGYLSISTGLLEGEISRLKSFFFF